MSLSSQQRRSAAVKRAQTPVSPLYAPSIQDAVQRSDGTMIARLLPEVYRKFEKGIPVIGSVPTNEYEQGFLAGAEFVLRKLRSEIVVGE